MTQHNAVHEILKEHRGKNNAITSREIKEEVGVRDTHDTNPNVRDIIRDLIEHHGVPILSHNGGYYIARNEEEVDEYVDRLESRREEIASRRDNIIEAFNQQDDLDRIVSSVELK